MNYAADYKWCFKKHLATYEHTYHTIVLCQKGTLKVDMQCD